MFNNLTTEGLEKAQDRLGGGFQALETDIYIGTIKALYGTKSSGGATGLVLIADIDGREYTETYWVTDKTGKNYFLNKQDPTKKVPLAGFTHANDLCLLTLDMQLSEIQTEDKVINLYNYDQKKDVATSVPMVTEAIGKTVALGILREKHNKSEKNASGEYVDQVGTERFVNQTDKLFHPEMKVTVLEAQAGATEAKFWDGWLERNKGKDRDKRTYKDGAEGGSSGAPPKAAAAAPARTSLFGKK